MPRLETVVRLLALLVTASTAAGAAQVQASLAELRKVLRVRSYYSSAT
jgi:hypothetical protein